MSSPTVMKDSTRRDGIRSFAIVLSNFFRWDIRYELNQSSHTSSRFIFAYTAVSAYLGGLCGELRRESKYNAETTEVRRDTQRRRGTQRPQRYGELTL